MLTVDLIIPTYNRAAILGEALASVHTLVVPADVRATVTIIDNNSSDDTGEVAASFAETSPFPVNYLFEPRQGRQFALNSAIAASKGGVVAMFDDDERLDPRWLEIIAREFSQAGVDYIGGLVAPDWSTAAPVWVPQGYGGVLGIIDNGERRRRYGEPGFHGMLTGGNCAIRRPVLEACLPYPSHVTYAEDRYLYERLMTMGAAGFYVPDFVVHHRIPATRVRKSYFRQWARTEGVNLAKLARMNGDARGFLGLPRWRWRQFAQAALTTLAGLGIFGRDDPRRFKAELDVLQDLAFLLERNTSLVRFSYRDRSRVG